MGSPCVSDRERVLDPAAVRAYYDRFGSKQDHQGFYEDPALDDLIAHAGFQTARHVFEFGCGTGKLAARLLERPLPAAATYLGCDGAPVMIDLAEHRLQRHAGRARVILSDGAIRFPLADRSVDRVVCCYVLDLLAGPDIERFLAESRRVIEPGGKVCIASLTNGVGLPSRLVSKLWHAIFRISPAVVGGCRPIDLDARIDPREWRVAHRCIVTPFGVPSQVLILEANDQPATADEIEVAGCRNGH